MLLVRKRSKQELKTRFCEVIFLHCPPDVSFPLAAVFPAIIKGYRVQSIGKINMILTIYVSRSSGNQCCSEDASGNENVPSHEDP